MLCRGAIGRCFVHLRLPLAMLTMRNIQETFSFVQSFTNEMRRSDIILISISGYVLSELGGWPRGRPCPRAELRK